MLGVILKKIKYVAIAVVVIITLGLCLPESLVIPVKGATSNDWNHNTFWYEPWGTSGVHKGIDIFGVKTTPVVASVSGVVVYAGKLKKGGNVIAILGPKWRVHYFAHLDKSHVNTGKFVNASEIIGTLGDTGNAAGKQPHVHYSIVSLLPLPWLISSESQGWKRMFYLSPHEKLIRI